MFLLLLLLFSSTASIENSVCSVLAFVAIPSRVTLSIDGGQERLTKGKTHLLMMAGKAWVILHFAFWLTHIQTNVAHIYIDIHTNCSFTTKSFCTCCWFIMVCSVLRQPTHKLGELEFTLRQCVFEVGFWPKILQNGNNHYHNNDEEKDGDDDCHRTVT